MGLRLRRPGHERFRGQPLSRDRPQTAPIGQVYLGLAALTEQVAPDKVLLGFSAQATAWQIDGEGDLLSGTPVYPSAETVAKRLAQPDTEKGWSGAYQQPYARLHH